jgi:hypothetical protein
VPLPKATVSHSSPGRIRLKVPEMRGDQEYFMGLAEKCSMLKQVETLEVNPLTAGVLVTGEEITENALADMGQKKGLFFLELSQAPVPAPSQIVVSHLKSLNEKVRSFTHGGLELATLVFTGLLFTGIYQILRGNLRSPPWYTAFWYAFGIFGKTLMDRSKDKT